jgi:hypothetical protein
MPLAQTHAPSRRSARGRPVRLARRRDAASAPAGVLAPGAALTLPSLAGVPTVFARTASPVDARLRTFARALSEGGWVTDRMFAEAAGSLERFCDLGIGAVVRADVPSPFDLVASLNLEEGLVWLALDVSSALDFGVGHVLDAMESAGEEGVAAWWLNTVRSACCAAGRTYDWSDAIARIDMTLDMMEEVGVEGEEDDATAKANFDQQVASCQGDRDLLRKAAFDGVPDLRGRALREARARVAQLPLGTEALRWADRLRRASKAADRTFAACRVRSGRMIASRMEGEPLPYALLFRDRFDLVTTLFDEEGQHYYEGDTGPCLVIACDADMASCVRGLTALRAVRRGLDELVEFRAWLDATRAQNADTPRPDPAT